MTELTLPDDEFLNELPLEEREIVVGILAQLCPADRAAVVAYFTDAEVGFEAVSRKHGYDYANTLRRRLRRAFDCAFSPSTRRLLRSED